MQEAAIGLTDVDGSNTGRGGLRLDTPGRWGDEEHDYDATAPVCGRKGWVGQMDRLNRRCCCAPDESIIRDNGHRVPLDMSGDAGGHSGG